MELIFFILFRFQGFECDHEFKAIVVIEGSAKGITIYQDGVGVMFGGEFEL